MRALKVVLFVQFLAIVAYSAIAVRNHGTDLFNVFFNEIAALTWSGQFNFDFLQYLILSGLWVAWRHRFSVGGILLGVAASIFGIMVFAPYLLYAASKADGEFNKFFLGDRTNTQ